MATKVKSYRINITDDVQEGDAIVIGQDGGMVSCHLGTVSSLDAGTSCGDIPVLGEGGKLDTNILPDDAMKASVYDKCNCNADAFNYDNFYNKPTIPEVFDPVITFTQGGISKGSISLNQQGPAVISLDAGGVTAGTAIDINNSIVSVKYDNCSIKTNNNKLEVNNYDTIVSGAAAGATAVQADDLATVAMTGNYCDLINKPEIPSAQIQSDWGQANTNLPDYIKNKPTIGNAIITLQKNGTDVDTFTLNQTANKCLNLTLSKGDVGLANVDNTSDIDKPISTATQTSLNCKQDNITDLNTIRTNSYCGKCAYDTIGNYGDIVSHDVCEFATATQGGKADTAVQPGDLCDVATSGKYCDLSGTPTIPTDNCQLANSCGYTTCTGTLVSSDLEPYAKTCILCSVATSGSYTDLSNKPTIPTDNCQLANSCGYITNAVNDLTNYYLKCETYQKCEVDNLISNFGGFEVVATLPTTNIKTNVIYLLGPIGTGPDKYEEWIYYNNTWTKIGETTTDLSNYAKCCDIPTDNCQLGNGCGYTTCTGTLVASDLQPYTKTCDLCTVATSGKYCDLTGTPTIPTDNCQLANSCGYTTCTGTLVSSDLAPYAKSCDLKAVATSGKYCDLTGTPSLATVATSGCYNDLSGKPSLCTVATSGCYSDLSGTPSLATVATSGCYNDLTGKPTIPTDNCQLSNGCNYITKSVNNLDNYTPTTSLAAVATSGAYCDLTGTPSLACVACSGSYEDLTCKPNLGVYQTTANMVCTLANADDSHYPSAKTVADALSCAGAGDMLSSMYDPNGKCADAFDYTNFINTPSLCTVATSGKYCDLTGTPIIPAALNAGSGISITSNCINVLCDNNTIKKNSNNCLYADFTGLATTASLCTVATTGCYNDLTGKPTIPTDNCQLANSCGYTTCTGTLVSSDLNPYAKTCTLCAVATSGKYCDLTGTPTIPSQLTSGTGICIDNNKVNAQNLYVINEDIMNVTYTGELGVAPYNTCYCYTNVDIDENSGVERKEGATYIFNLDTKVATSACRNVRLRIGSGNYIPLMGTSSVVNGNSYFVKAAIRPFQYSTKYESNGALHALSDSNTTYSAMSLAEGETGTATSCRTITAACLKPIIKYHAVDDTAYSSSWNGKADIAPSKNAVYDKLSSMDTCISGKVDGSSLCAVATSGKYCDLTGQPTVPTDNCQLANGCGYVKSSSLCTVATSGMYCDLNGTPTIPTNNNQLTNGCGYTTCTGTVVASDLNSYAKCCDLKTVATTGCYNDLTGKPTIPTNNNQLTNGCGYTTCTGTVVASDLTPYAKSCTLCTVATTGKYCDLTGVPAIPTVGNATITMSQGGTSVGCFTTNSSTAQTINFQGAIYLCQECYDVLPSSKNSDGNTYIIAEYVNDD